MFEPCPKIEMKICGFAGSSNNVLHCGIMSGSLEATTVSSIVKCTKEMTVKEIKEHIKRFKAY